MFISQQSITARMHLRVCCLMLALLLAACSSMPTPPTKPEQSIVNQADDAATEVQFSQNLNELLSQVAQAQEIPLQSLEWAF